MLLSLPQDVIGHMAQFLAPRDFYSVKTAVAAGDDANCLYWWSREVTFERATGAKCASLIRWIGKNDPELSQHEVLNAAASAVRNTSNNFEALVAIYNVFKAHWPRETPHLMTVFAEHGASRIFQYLLVRAPSSINDDVIDMAYFCSRWMPIAITFRYAPHAFINWAFGNYQHAADAEIVKNLHFLFYYLDQNDRNALSHILQKYHEWLWSYKTDTTTALATIAALQNLEYKGVRIINFEPESYLDRAMRSPHADYLEYLVMCGLNVDPAIMHRTRDFGKLRVLMDAHVMQKYYKIMILLMILISAIALNLFSTNYASPKNNKAKVADLYI